MNKPFAGRVAVIAAVVAAALVAVPAAFGDAAKPADFWNYDQATGAKVADTSPGVAPDELAALHSADAALVVSTEPSTGREIAWQQIGAGVGLGLLVVAGTLLALRVRRARLFAH